MAKNGSQWREISQSVIRDVLSKSEYTEDAGGGDEEAVNALKKEISKAYPFGERKYWPYKVWLSEVKNLTKNIKGFQRESKAANDIRNYWVK